MKTKGTLRGVAHRLVICGLAGTSGLAFEPMAHATEPAPLITVRSPEAGAPPAAWPVLPKAKEGPRNGLLYERSRPSPTGGFDTGAYTTSPVLSDYQSPAEFPGDIKQVKIHLK